MEINTRMAGADLAVLNFEVDAANKALNEGKGIKASLGKDDFLKILVTQLQNQDPTAPMEDREFIGQMAQFSSLEQITNMSQNFSKLSGLLNSSEAQGLLGRTVEIVDGQSVTNGVVTQIVRGDSPLVLVEGRFYDLDQVSKVIQ
ncbi:MAG: flagellar hook assembly protein FlgD [Spirochaetes bacterium]|nr:flagellar hook assembly protein FlgD [Spirochaetota bacterium]